MKIVIFDMDGTLIDSGSDITASINHVRQKVYNLEPLSIGFVVEAINREQRNLALLFYGTETYQPSAQELFEAHYHDQCIRSPRLYPGIRRLLQGLATGEVRLGVATNAPSFFARRMLRHLGIDLFFDWVVGSEDVEKSKPHPAMLQLILDDCGFQADRDFGLMVGDNAKDMEAARRAGIAGAFVTWGFSPQGEGDFVCSHPGELLQLLDKDDKTL